MVLGQEEEEKDQEREAAEFLCEGVSEAWIETLMKKTATWHPHQRASHPNSVVALNDALKDNR